MLVDIITGEVDELISDFSKTFPESDLIKNKRDVLIATIQHCFDNRRITEKESGHIYKILLLNLNIDLQPKKLVKLPKEDYVQFMMRKWGEELGSLLLLFNKAIAGTAREIMLRNLNKVT
jgi:hypothetical protein